MKALYLETIPIKHTKLFETKHEAYVYWEKRFRKFINWDCLQNLKAPKPHELFDGKVISLNKDGKPRKKTESKPLTKKQRDNHKKAMKKRSDDRKKIQEIKKVMEGNLEYELNKKGYEGIVTIKFFKRLKENGN